MSRHVDRSRRARLAARLCQECGEDARAHDAECSQASVFAGSHSGHDTPRSHRQGTAA